MLLLKIIKNIFLKDVYDNEWIFKFILCCKYNK